MASFWGRKGVQVAPREGSELCLVAGLLFDMSSQEAFWGGN